jgi:hypothetical protein
MKKRISLGLGIAGLMCFGSLSAVAETANAEGSRVELPVEALLIPATGFEEKNTIQAVLYGMLPNSCYTLSEYQTEKSADGHTLTVRQYAIRDNTGICSEEMTLPTYLNMRVPFTTEVSVGHLEAGAYRFAYNKAGSGRQVRDMVVSRNASPQVDSLPYAAVSTVQSTDVINGHDHLKVTISGVLNSSCTTLDETVRVLPEDDVTVLLPTIKVKRDVLCVQMLIPFKKSLDLGSVTPGIHLIHVRSMNGKSVNHVVNVAR